MIFFLAISFFPVQFQRTRKPEDSRELLALWKKEEK